MPLDADRERVVLEFGGHTISSVAEEDVDRTTADGKASSVQFVHFPFTAEQAALFKEPGTRVAVGITHEAYPHLAILSEETRAELGRDLD